MNINKPLISIIIPTFNRAHLIGETLDSVLAQTYQNWECIVVDDGSTDDTEEVMQIYCQKDNRIKYFHRPMEHLPGGNGARNYGFKMSKGEYIQWFDSDDLMDIDCLNFKIKNIGANDLLITSGRKRDEFGNYTDLRMSFDKDQSLFKEIVTYESEIMTPTVFIKRDALAPLKLFDEYLKRGQETEFFARLSFENQFKYSFINKGLFTYRLHKDSKSSQPQTIYLTSRVKYFLDNFERGLILKDSDLIVRFYKKIIAILFEFIKIKDKSNFNYNYNNFVAIVDKHKLNIHLLKLLPFFNLIGFHSEKIRKYFINQID